MSDSYTECGQLEDGGVGCRYTGNPVTKTGIKGGSGCGEKGLTLASASGGPNCGESHPSGKLGALNNVGEALAVGIIIAIAIGGLVGAVLLLLLLRWLVLHMYFSCGGR